MIYGDKVSNIMLTKKIRQNCRKVRWNGLQILDWQFQIYSTSKPRLNPKRDSGWQFQILNNLNIETSSKHYIRNPFHPRGAQCSW
jgi:hypothetical protein